MYLGESEKIKRTREVAIKALNSVYISVEKNTIAHFIKKGFISSLEDQSSPTNIFPLVSHPARCFNSYQVDPNSKEMQCIYEIFDEVLSLIEANPQFQPVIDDSVDIRIEKYKNQSLLIINFLYLYFFTESADFQPDIQKLIEPFSKIYNTEIDPNMTILKYCLFSDFVLFFTKELGQYIQNNHQSNHISLNDIIILAPMLQNAISSLEQENPTTDKHNEDFTLSFVKSRIRDFEIEKGKKEIWKSFLSTSTLVKTKSSDNPKNYAMDSDISDITQTNSSQFSSVSSIPEINSDSGNTSMSDYDVNLKKKQKSINAVYGALIGLSSFLGITAGLTALSVGVGIGIGMSVMGASACASAATTLGILSGIIIGGAALFTPIGWGIVGLAVLMTISFAVGKVFMSNNEDRQNNQSIKASTTPLYTSSNYKDFLASNEKYEIPTAGQASR